MNAKLRQLLKQTSRSFYLTLRVLPDAVRSQIGLTYLLARTTDTIADTGLVSVEQRLEALNKFRQRIQGNSSDLLSFRELASKQGSPAERALLERCEEGLAELKGLSAGDARLIRQVLETITGGQELDLRRFAGTSAQNIVALQTDADLDDYTYRVAGCVGEFWTKMCRAHLFPQTKLDDAQLLADGVRFGKGLQLVNILRDLSSDLHQGRCYLPAERLARAGLQPNDLVQPASETRLRPLYHEHLDRALAHLAAGWAYTNALPRGQVRVRLACAWPILIGVRTLGRLRQANPLDALQRVKLSRAEVRGIMLRSLWCYPGPRCWWRQFEACQESGKAVASRRDLP